MKGKYCHLYWSVKKTDKGYMWTIKNKEGEVLQTSLDNERKEDHYYEAKITAVIDAKEAIEDYYI